MVERCVEILADLSEKVAPHVPFVLDCIGPESVIDAGILLADQKTNQIIELSVWYSLDIEEQFNILPGERRDMM